MCPENCKLLLFTELHQALVWQLKSRFYPSLASISHRGEDTDDSQYESDEEQDNEFPQSEDNDSPEFAGKEMSIFIFVSVVHFFIPSRYSPSQIASVSKVFKFL